MMLKPYFILIFIFGFISISKANYLIEIRELYYEASQKEEGVEKLEKKLNAYENLSIIVGYKGANEMLKSKYAWNPYSKFSHFSDGKKLLEKAIKSDENNIELRYLRYSIQTNAPSFLGYADDIEKDKKFILNNFNASKDKDLKKRIYDYMAQSEYWTKDEIKKLEI